MLGRRRNKIIEKMGRCSKKTVQYIWIGDKQDGLKDDHLIRREQTISRNIKRAKYRQLTFEGKPKNKRFRGSKEIRISIIPQAWDVGVEIKNK
jgi:hypothetical protein